MPFWINGMQMLTAVLACAAALAALRPARNSVLQRSWAVFCLALAAVLVQNAFGSALGSAQYLTALFASATCSVFWLVARALFRPGIPFEARHLLLVMAIAVPGFIRQVWTIAIPQTQAGASVSSVVLDGLGSTIVLLSSTTLVLAFWEGIRDWRTDLSRAERRMRAWYLTTYGSCVFATTVWTVKSSDVGTLADVGPALETISAFCILWVAGFAVRFRIANPLPIPGVEGTAPRTAEPTAEDFDLAESVVSCVESQRLYLEQDLKVSRVAELLGVPEYRVSRAISAGSQSPNFNQFINRFRVAHAQNLLRDEACAHWPVLVIGLESGFASVGPFNRAFKNIVGMTPSSYRAAANAKSMDWAKAG